MVNYDTTPENIEELRKRINACPDEHLGTMIGRTLLLIRDAETRSMARTIVRLCGATELTDERVQEYNHKIITMCMEEVHKRLGRQ